jgi:hypothetical protein
LVGRLVGGPKTKLGSKVVGKKKKKKEAQKKNKVENKK